MESDGFTQPVADDPFAGSDFGDFDQTVPEPPAEAIPTVDREGQPVGTLPTLTPEQQAAEGAAYRENTGEPDTAAGVAPEPSHVPQDGASVESQESEAAPTQPIEPQTPIEPQDPTPAASDGTTGSTTETPIVQQPVQPDPEAAAEKVEAALRPDDSSPADPPAQDEEAPPPEERKTKGRVTHRRYVVLRVTAADKFERLYWYEDGDGKVVPRGQGRKQGVTLQRSTEDALRFAFAAIGSPQDGATLVPVAELYFQPRRVKPRPPVPERQALEIT